MDAAIATSAVPNLAAEGREITKQQMRGWFAWMDHLLDIHRSNYVFREVTPAELEQHKEALKWAIRFSHIVNVLVADPDLDEPELARGLQIRIRQLQDAYDTFHDSEITDEKAEQILRQVFPE